MAAKSFSGLLISVALVVVVVVLFAVAVVLICHLVFQVF